MNQPDAAMADYKKAIALKPLDAHLRMNFGHFLADIRRHADALASYRAAWQIKPDTPFLLGYLLYTQLMNCDWENINAGRDMLRERMTQDARAASPFPMLSLTDDPALQRKSAEIWARLKYPPQQVPYTQAPAGPKIRVGYFSMDFRQHALATLTAGLYEAHDREKFEIYAFSYGPDTGDAMRKRLEKAFDTFIDVRDRSDAEIATLARTIGIDIAVDLAGYTKQARTGIFALRAAPIQIGYLGFPGTMGTPYMDYIIGDDIVIPFEARDHYAEHIIHLPTYQANDHKRERPQITLSRGELGLPEKGFVFCSFNNAYKFSPETFSSWMRILHRVEGAVLFLYADHEVTAENLSREATARGIDRKRLVFGKQLDMEGYLARYKAAGLFLDTLPYNAGTTAADALWMGLPVLTCTGRGFASRMAASLLNAAGVQELITHTREDYEDRAVELATHPQQLAALRSKLAHVEATLFNTPAFTRSLESAYIQVVARARAGLPPAHVHIK
jgi:predicted O-linked N-acetylglucosamine transferase (SPINDLY family)